MNEIYWLTRLDDVKVLLGFAIALCVVGFVFAIAAMIFNYDQRYSSEVRYYDLGKYWAKRLGIILTILGVGTSFIPDTKEAYQIIGIGKTIEYLKENETAKQLPDKCIIALDKYLTEINDED